jgi:hypothetical protein
MALRVEFPVLRQRPSPLFSIPQQWKAVLHGATVAYGANLVVYSVRDKRGLRVEVVGNFLWGPGFYGN